MKASESHIHRLLDGVDKKFIIPVYQRPYSWKKENCKLLLNDLNAIYEKGYKSHFFGGIVYVANEVAGVYEYIIIDGQQRITTISLLLLAIRNYIIKNDIETEINTEKITTAYLTDKYANDDKKLKLKLVQGDDESYDQLIAGNEPTITNNLTNNYNYFYAELSKYDSIQIEGVYAAIMKLQIVNISLTTANGDDPQLIFESLNSTGLALDESDKIRNYVLMNLESKKQAKIYKEYWEPIENLATRDDIDKFIRHYLAAKTNELTNENRLYFAFKHYKQTNNFETEALLEDMLQYAKWYNDIKNATPTTNDYHVVLTRLNKLEANTAVPLIFNLFHAHNSGLLDDQELQEALQVIESYIVRRFICGLPTNQLNKVFVGLGAEINKHIEQNDVSYLAAMIHSLLGKTGKSRFPNNIDFADCFSSYELYTARASFKKYFLEQLENAGSREKVAVEEQINNGTLTIEHIMPQALTQDWQQELGENWELTHAKYKDTIGNLTLTAYNSDYSNLPFTKKKDMPVKGFIHSKLFLNKFIQQCNIWNEDLILERTKILLEKAEKIWSFPESDFNPQNEEQWIDWDEEFNFTNMRIAKIKIMGDEIKTSDITDAYRKVNITLYELDTVTYLSEKNTQYSKTASNYRSPTEVAAGVFIELNLSSNAKIKAIANIAEMYKLEPKDLQFLVIQTKKKE